MVATVSTTLNPKTTTQRRPRQNPTRPPLLPSEPDNANAPRRPKAREVTSRYLSSSSSSSSSNSNSLASTPNSRRCPSPLLSRTVSSSATMTPMPSASSLLAKRSQSVERRRLVTPRPNSPDLRIGNGNGDVSSAAQRLLCTSTRSLSVSFQGESFSFQVSKAKPAPTPSVRKGTPERRKATTPSRGSDQTENSKPLMDQHRWPARLRQANCMSRSLDCTDERKKLGGSGSVVRALQNSMVDVRASFDGRLNVVESEKEVERVDEANSGIGSETPSDSNTSDSESVSSGSTSGAQDCGGGGGGGLRQRGPARGIMIPARFWQETNNRLRRYPEPGSPLSKTVGTKTLVPSPKLIAPKKLSVDSLVLSPRGVVNSRGQLSPIRGALGPASPGRPLASPSRGISPSRVRTATPSNNLSNMPSILSFAGDVRRGKIGENRIVDAHLLRLLHNRFLQWRFINARADTALSVQRLNAERSLYNAWVTTLKVRESVRSKRTELQLLRQNLKLTSILKGQMTYLEEWALMDRDYFSSLSGATEALRASTLRLPVVGGAKADVQNVKEAIHSAVDVMQAMASSICLLLSKVGEVNSLVGEIANISTKEHALLDQCKDLLSTIAAMQVTECSLRTHTVQINRVPPRLKMKV